LISIRAALQPIVAGLEKFPPLSLVQGKDYLLPELSLKLVEQAYQRVDMVSRRGEFAVRGGILDIFPTTAEHAVRLEFFGDELEEIREFSVADQRSSTTKIEKLTLYPARELIITPAVASRAREMMHEFPNLSAMLEKISLGMPVEGMESLAPALADAMVSIFDYHQKKQLRELQVWLKPTRSFCMQPGMQQWMEHQHQLIYPAVALLTLLHSVRKWRSFS
jgi:transcription-repair coupling factor (superfamily II helicase)